MDKFKTFFFILTSFLAVASGGFALVRYLQMAGAIIFSVLGIIWLLIVSGLIGPKNLKSKMREFLTWTSTKTVLFFPIHPYKPIDEALKGGVKEFLPTKERIQNFLIYRFLFKVITFVLAIIIISGFFAWQYFNAPKETSQNTVSLVYTSENYAWGEQLKRIELSKDGKISHSSKVGNKKEESSKQLSVAELKEISDFIISQKFFDLPNDLTNAQCADAPTEYLEITINQKTHRAGGSCVENEVFRVILEKLEEIAKNKIIKEETADWETYFGNGFEFKYPEDWAAIESARPGYPYLVFITLGPESTIQQGGSFAVAVRNQTEDEYLSTLQKEFTIGSSDKTLLGGRAAAKYIFYRPDNKNLQWKTVVAKLGNLLIEFSRGATPEKDDIFNQIISTLQFIESKQSLGVPTNCEDKQDSLPVITSLSGYSGSVGIKLEINGCNFSGFEGDKNAWIENGQGIKGLLRGGAESTSKILKVTLNSPLCQKDISYSGLPCDAWLTLTPGIYKIYVMPWGKKSNEVTFIIK